MYWVYGNSCWYLHGGPLLGEGPYWEGPLSEVPLYSPRPPIFVSLIHINMDVLDILINFFHEVPQLLDYEHCREKYYTCIIK